MTTGGGPRSDAATAIASFVLFALLLASPLPFGSVQPPYVLGIELGAALAGGLAAWIVWRDPGRLSGAGRVGLALAGAVLLIGGAQLLPLPRSLVAVLAGPTVEARDGIALAIDAPLPRWMPLTLSPPATVDALLRWSAYLAIGLAAAVCIRSERQRLVAAGLLSLAGAFQALYGSAEYLSGHQHIFWYPKRYFTDEASGTFINRNHFAAYLSICLPLAAAATLDGYRRLRAVGVRWRVLVLLTEAGGSWVVLAAVATASIWIGIVLSFSRGGLAASLVGITILVGGLLRRKRGAVWLLALLAIPTAALLAMEVRAPGARFVTEADHLADFGGRLEVWTATGEIVGDYPLAGAGFGTFQPIFQLYRHPATRKLWDHAHNDWLQAAAEGGVALPLLMLGLLVVGWKRASASPGDVIGLAILAALVAIAVHSAVDFALRIPAIAVSTAFLVGCACGGDLAAPRRLWNHRSPGRVRSSESRCPTPPP
ncbi:MAG TPA: O-antigen ligase family protein [Candidatus Polarisedimenticolaceae bacterium]|nr:O-antigen ligase family protein [Candidatus Polarisedimenticolaceae bacterium]